MPVSDSGRTYKVQVTVGGREPVRAAGPDRSTRGRSPRRSSTRRARPAGRSMAMWISDDERKLPLKLQAELAVGSFQLTLREAR